MLRSIFASIALLTAPAYAQYGASVDYNVSFDNAVHHEAEITVSFNDIGETPLDLRMSRSSPGRYALHEFAKNIYSVKAVDSAGHDLNITRTDPYSWQVNTHDGAVTVTYTLYANHGDGTYSQIDLTHAHLNMPATFMWARGFEDRPITVSFDPPYRNWKAATQLRTTRRAMTFTAPNLQYFMDSPTELSNFDMREWQIGEGDKRQTIRLAVHHDGEEKDLDIFTEKAKKVVAEQIKIFGEAPEFDYDIYTFIADYLPHVDGDGMEHRNSTILTRSTSLFEDDFAQLGTLSHEFFHTWNVERMRPAELEPFDFSNTNPTPSLWFAEGFTRYYGRLAIRRAGESSTEAYATNLGRTLSHIINAPGRKFGSPQSMSVQAAFVDAARAVDPTNNENIFVSYYPYGAMVALALDLTLRQRFEDLTLDDYMRHLWGTHGKTELPYTHDDLRRGLADITGDTEFADGFFAAYIENGDLPDYAPLLAEAGLKLQLKNEGGAWLGSVNLKEDGKTITIASNTLRGSPLYETGLSLDDEIVRIGRFKIHDTDDWERALKRHEPGDKVKITYRQRGVKHVRDITFAEDPALEIVLFEDADLEPTDTQIAFRNAWLGPDSDDAENE
ncbi:MAG: M61 family metallopeptidase [Alphaproteobacteria bacterium]|nr:M61 family metallopeptidase [Alphaproteobacteria bacterium]